MSLLYVVRAFFALAVVLGLIGLCAAAVRRYAPGLMARFAAPRAARRLAVVETLVLDPSRRLVLVSCDGREKLLLLGDGRIVEAAVDGKGIA